MLTDEQRHVMRVAHEAQQALLRQMPNVYPTKETLIALGQFAWPHAHRLHDCDGEALESLRTYVDNAARAGDPAGLLVSSELVMPQYQFVYTAASMWYNVGLPQIVLAGHKYAAALLATQLSKDILEDIVPPWPAFYLEIPRGLLHVYDGAAKREVTITGVLVAHIEGKRGLPRRWGFFAIAADSTVTLWKFGMTAERLLQGNVPGDFEGEPFLLPIEDLDERCASLLGRLILNVCLAMTDPTQVRAPKEPKKGKKGKHNKRGSKEPTVRTYVLGKTPAFDCRPQVEAYMRTGRAGSQLNVQSMVSGHWKRQAYGPRRELRKTIWVEPYWRGPEDAPILAKPRVLGKGAE